MTPRRITRGATKAKKKNQETKGNNIDSIQLTPDKNKTKPKMEAAITKSLNGNLNENFDSSSKIDSDILGYTKDEIQDQQQLGLDQKSDSGITIKVTDDKMRRLIRCQRFGTHTPSDMDSQKILQRMKKFKCNTSSGVNDHEKILKRIERFK